MEGVMDYSRIRMGGMYSNGIFGRHWSVRQIVAVSPLLLNVNEEASQSVTYKVLAGTQRRSTFTCSREEFARWASYEVGRNENSWVRLG